MVHSFGWCVVHCRHCCIRYCLLPLVDDAADTTELLQLLYSIILLLVAVSASVNLNPLLAGSERTFLKYLEAFDTCAAYMTMQPVIQYNYNPETCMLPT